MNKRILELAKECGMGTDLHHDLYFEAPYKTLHEMLEDFYKAAFNDGIAAAAKECTEEGGRYGCVADHWTMADHLTEAVKELEKK